MNVRLILHARPIAFATILLVILGGFSGCGEAQKQSTVDRVQKSFQLLLNPWLSGLLNAKSM